GKATHPAIPQVVFGVLAATGGCLVMLLPETNNRQSQIHLQKPLKSLDNTDNTSQNKFIEL
ncbi:hypothetical protein TNCT_681751, partial [Trichonephila clavata]